MENNWKKHPRIFQLRASRYLKSFSILSSRQMIDLPIQVKACAKIQFWNEKVPIILVGQTTYLRLYMLQQHRTYHSKHSQPTSQLTTGLHPFHDGHSNMNSPSPLINTRMCLSIKKTRQDLHMKTVFIWLLRRRSTSYPPIHRFHSWHRFGAKRIYIYKKKHLREG
jgi:hypothetical protein